MPDLLTLTLLLLVVTIAVAIARAIRLTQGEIAKGTRSLPLGRADVARRLIEQMSSRDVRCPGCGAQASAMLGTGTRYTCDTCAHDFDGPAHIPAHVV